MAFSTMLTNDHVIVEPGMTMPLGIEVTNKGTDPDNFELSIEGLDGNWVAVPVPMFPLNIDESQTIKIFFQPPRTSGKRSSKRTTIKRRQS